MKSNLVENENRTTDRVYYMTIMLLMVTLFCYITYNILTVPFVGLEAELNDKGEVIVSGVYPLGRAYDEGIREGDRILEIDGELANDYKVLSKIARVQQTTSILLSSGSSPPKMYTFTTDGFDSIPRKELLFDLIIPLFFFLSYSIISIVLYVKCKQDKAAKILILFFAMIGVSYYSSPISFRGDPVGKLLMRGILPIVPFIFMYFMNVYLRRFNVSFYKSRFTMITILIIELFTIFNFLYIVTDVFSSEALYSISMLNYTILIIGYGLCLYSLIDVYIKQRHTKLKPLFKIMMASHAVAFTPFVVLNLLPLLLFDIHIILPNFTALSLIALPIGYLYLFTSKRLFDIDFIFTRFKYYALIASIPSVLITLLVLLITKTERYFIQGIQCFLVVYGGMILLLYLKEQIDYRYRPKLFKQMYSFQDSLDRYSSKLSEAMKREDLELELTKEIQAMMPVQDVYFLTKNKDGSSVNLPEEMTISEKDYQLLMAHASLRVSDIIDLEDGICLIIGQRKEEFHAIWIGNKINNTRFNVDELRWLKTVANYTSIVYENLYLIQSLLEDLEAEVRKGQSASPWVLRLIFCLSENERRRLASDLHDSALQDQLLWFRKLESFLSDHKFQMSPEWSKQLHDIKEGLLDVIFQIRETCNELRPPLLKELGLTESLESLIEHLRLHVNFDVQFKVKPVHSMLNEEQITAVYRIVQELLRNTAKHAQANKVMIELKQMGNQIHFHYKDDGVGMDLQKMQSSFSHMGMSGIRERVISLEGEIQFHSEKGQGFDVRITLPTTLSSGKGERDNERDSYLIS